MHDTRMVSLHCVYVDVWLDVLVLYKIYHIYHTCVASPHCACADVKLDRIVV